MIYLGHCTNQNPQLNGKPLFWYVFPVFSEIQYIHICYKSIHMWIFLFESEFLLSFSVAGI